MPEKTRAIIVDLVSALADTRKPVPTMTDRSDRETCWSSSSPFGSSSQPAPAT